MNERLLEYLICPSCLPEELDLISEITEQQGTDITTGNLICPSCGSLFPIIDGIAFLDPAGVTNNSDHNKYEQEEIVSSYLWSHYGDLLGEYNWSDAYPNWAKEIQPTPGLALDIGGAVGRFTFELARKCTFSVGIDSSVAFIRAARELMQNGKLTVHLKEEGRISRKETIQLPQSWLKSRVAFIVADAMRLPVRSGSTSVISSLNLVDKVVSPLQHLSEMSRVCKSEEAQLLFSDPFSWSEEAAPVKEWLGGKRAGPYAGFGLDNIRKLLCTESDDFSPAWQEEKKHYVWWKIRTHRNHYELIRSCYLKMKR